MISCFLSKHRKDTDMKEEKSLICYFHIVNSVKGGSGKSTFALLLANHFLTEGKIAYIIDLDVCGTSWETDFKKFFTKENDFCYVNDLMYQYCTNGFKHNIWSELKVTDTDANENTTSDNQIKICLAANPRHNKSFNKSEAELLENATYQIILSSINEVLSTHPTKDIAIHIILDLPPNHEQTVEQICQHLLFDQSSRLKQYFLQKNKSIDPLADKDTDKSEVKFKYKYKVQFYMMTPADQVSALEKNADYIRDLLFEKRKYSSNILAFEANDELQFKICFVLNDNHYWSSLQAKDSISPQTLIDNANSIIKLPDIFHPKKNDEKITYFTVNTLQYQPFEFKKNMYMGTYKNITPPTSLNLHGASPTEIKDIIKDIII